MQQLDEITVSTQNVNDRKETMRKDLNEADFETAINATGFGKFNFILYFLLLLGSLTIQFEVTTMSYINSAAECDLHLSLEDKGMLNAITYLGIISSSFFGGYLSDTLGRRKILCIMYLIVGTDVVIYSFSQTYTVLLCLKFLGGVFVGAPYSALLPYISEFHDAKTRGRVSLIMGFFHATGNIVLPLLAWVILPLNFETRLFGNLIVLHSWNIYLTVCGISGLLAGLTCCFMPESPKFLMTAGRNDRALEIFKKVYAINTGKSKESYPVKSLLDETKLKETKYQQSEDRKVGNKMNGGLKQMLSIFLPPHTINLIFVLIIQMGIMCGMNTLRLWLPQLYASVNDYSLAYPNISASLCEMISFVKTDTVQGNATEECVVSLLEDSFYIRNIIVAAAAMLAFILASLFVGKIGRKPLFVFCGTVGGICGICLYFAKSIEVIVTLASINIALCHVGVLIILGICVDLFPTSLRTMTIALCSSVGRGGSMAGNIVFPLLLVQGCLPPFLFVGAFEVGSAILVMFLPKTDMKALE